MWPVQGGGVTSAWITPDIIDGEWRAAENWMYRSVCGVHRPCDGTHVFIFRSGISSCANVNQVNQHEHNGSHFGVSRFHLVLAQNNFLARDKKAFISSRRWKTFVVSHLAVVLKNYIIIEHSFGCFIL